MSCRQQTVCISSLRSILPTCFEFAIMTIARASGNASSLSSNVSSITWVPAAGRQDGTHKDRRCRRLGVSACGPSSLHRSRGSPNDRSTRRLVQPAPTASPMIARNDASKPCRHSRSSRSFIIGTTTVLRHQVGGLSALRLLAKVLAQFVLGPVQCREARFGQLLACTIDVKD
jgi:hypothetical protein